MKMKSGIMVVLLMTLLNNAMALEGTISRNDSMGLCKFYGYDTTRAFGVYTEEGNSEFYDIYLWFYCDNDATVYFETWVHLIGGNSGQWVSTGNTDCYYFKARETRLINLDYLNLYRHKAVRFVIRSRQQFRYSAVISINPKYIHQ